MALDNFNKVPIYPVLVLLKGDCRAMRWVLQSSISCESWPNRTAHGLRIRPPALLLAVTVASTQFPEAAVDAKHPSMAL